MEEWKKYVDANGNFQLANFIYRTLNDLMKNSLDMGTLLSSDQQKLRAYKEQTKKVFKSKWQEIAQYLEYTDMIERCECTKTDKDVYCEICKGSRYMTSSYLSVKEVQEIGTFLNASQNIEIAEKLQKGLLKALNEMS